MRNVLQHIVWIMMIFILEKMGKIFKLKSSKRKIQNFYIRWDILLLFHNNGTYYYFNIWVLINFIIWVLQFYYLTEPMVLQCNFIPEPIFLVHKQTVLLFCSPVLLYTWTNCSIVLLYAWTNCSTVLLFSRNNCSTLFLN